MIHSHAADQKMIQCKRMMILKPNEVAQLNYRTYTNFIL